MRESVDPLLTACEMRPHPRLLIFLLVTWASAAGAQTCAPAPSQGAAQETDLALQALYLPLPPAPTLAAAKERCGEFTSWDKPYVSHGTQRWARFRVDAPADAGDWYLSLPDSGYRRSCIYWPMAGAGHSEQCFGTQVDMDQWPLRSPTPLFPAPKDLDLDRDIYLSLIHSTGVAPRLHAATGTALIEQQFTAQLAFAVFVAAIIVSALISILAAAGLRDATYLYYSLHLAMLGLGLLGISGYGPRYFPQAYPVEPLLASLAMLVASFSFLLLCVGAFFRSKRRKTVGSSTLRVIAFVLLAVTAIMFRWPGLAEAITALSAIAALTFIIVASMINAAHDAPSRYLLAGSMMFALGVITHAMNVLGWISLDPAATFTLTQAGAVVSAGFTVFGILIRTQVIRAQRDRATRNALAQGRIAVHREQYDDVTGLASRRRLRSAGLTILSRAEFKGRPMVMAVAELDDFTTLEKELPQGFVDSLVKTVAERVKKAIPDAAMIARPSSDTVVVLSDGTVSDKQVAAQADALLRAISAPVPTAQGEMRITATVGVARFPEHGKTLDELLASAHHAVLEARGGGGNSAKVRDATAAESESGANAALRHQLWRAIKEDELVLVYQPITTLEERLHHFEALIRWDHLTRGRLGPGQFLVQVESSHLMVDLGRHVQHLALQALRNADSDSRVAINAAAIELQQPEYLDRLLAAISRHGVDPSRLELELTESSLVHDIAHTQQLIARCRDHGIGVWVDDFGTGYSSLNYIRELPLTGLKIDRSFTSRLGRSQEDQAIVTTIIDLAHRLGMQVIAEGVETQGQRHLLAAAGCDLYQGYLIGREGDGLEFRTNQIRERASATDAPGNPLNPQAATAGK